MGTTLGFMAISSMVFNWDKHGVLFSGSIKCHAPSGHHPKLSTVEGNASSFSQGYTHNHEPTVGDDVLSWISPLRMSSAQFSFLETVETHHIPGHSSTTTIAPILPHVGKVPFRT